MTTSGVVGERAELRVPAPQHPDPEDLEAFLAAMRPRVLGVLALQYEHAVAEELTQETLAVVYEKWAQVRRADSPQAFVFGVAHNLARSALRRRLAERRRIDRFARSQGAAAAGLDRADVLAVRDAVRRLPPRQRAALVLRYYADLPVADVAAVLGCSEGTVKSQVHDAIRSLRRGGLHEEGSGGD